VERFVTEHVATSHARNYLNVIINVEDCAMNPVSVRSAIGEIYGKSLELKILMIKPRASFD
jgi:hypothetical protein